MEALDEPGDIFSQNNNDDSLSQDFFVVVVAAACLVFFFCCFFCRLILFYFIFFRGERELDEILLIYLTLFDFICESENFCGSPGTKRGTIFNDFLGGRLATLP